MVTRCRYKQFFKMKLEDVLVMIGRKLLVMGYLKKYFTLHHPPPPPPHLKILKNLLIPGP